MIDYYPMVKAYGPWDDHEPNNVESQTPAIELVDDMSFHVDTDGQQTGVGHSGTQIADMESGLRTWLQERNLDDDYTLTTVHSPAFGWVANEVEQCEMEVLLLGFWQQRSDDPDQWVRLGGHYVSVAGIDTQGGLVGLSDPWFDRAEPGWTRLGRVRPIGTAHSHAAAPPNAVHNDAALLSHDIFRAIQTPSPGGTWGLEDYISGWDKAIENFSAQNESEGQAQPVPSQSVWTEVEWALALSVVPEPNLAITKRVTPTAPVLPGNWLTYTVVYTNVTTPLAYGVIITDLVAAELVSATLRLSNTFVTPVLIHDRYTLEVGLLGYLSGGFMTLTARVDPDLTGVPRTITNTAEIGSTTADRDGLNNRACVATRVKGRLYLPVVFRGHNP